MRTLDKVIRGVAGLLGLMFLVMGLRWLVDPGGAAGEIGLPLQEGLAMSSQIGDLGAFFMVTGGFALLGAITRNATLLYTPAALLGVAALFRLLAWQLHEAALATEFILFELVACAVLLFARQRFSRSESRAP